MIRSVRLRVIGGALIELREGVPVTRDECRNGSRPCPYVRCRYHLWIITAAERPGNPYKGDGPSSTLRPGWMEWPTPDTCSLDIAESIEPGEGLSRMQIGNVIGLAKTGVGLIESRGLEKLRASEAHADPTAMESDGSKKPSTRPAARFFEQTSKVSAKTTTAASAPLFSVRRRRAPNVR
jgi:hypothetical protein